MQFNLIFLIFIIASPVFANFVYMQVVGGSWDNSWLKSVLVPIADLFLNTFNSPATAIAFSVGILFAAIWFSLRLLRKASRVAAVMRHAGQRLRSRPNNLPADPIEALNVHPAIALAAERLMSEGQSAATPDASARQLESDLRLSAFDGRGMTFAFYRQLPEMFVAAGLVLTFCGLVAGLYFASRGLLAADLAVAKDALNRLLAASTFKFTTSIAGVGGSLMLTIANRLAHDKLAQARSDLAAALFANLSARRSGRA